MGVLLFSHFRVTNVMLMNEKNSLNIKNYSLNVYESLEINTTP